MVKNDMSDDQALGIIEQTLQARLSPKAARVISQGFLDIGVDAPAGRYAHALVAFPPVASRSQPFCFVPGKHA
jgi:hypothetical protein